jgi:RNA polymerase sigma-70 factor (ECF subfamily)
MGANLKRVDRRCTDRPIGVVLSPEPCSVEWSSMENHDWHACFDLHAARLLLYARQWLSDRASAEDAVQGAFVKVWRGLRSGGSPDLPLLYAAVRSEALDLLKGHARRRARETRVVLEATNGDGWWEDDPLVSAERAVAVRGALEHLPIEQREAVVLRVWSGLSFPEIARTLGENENTVAARCRRGLAALEKLLPEGCREST